MNITLIIISYLLLVLLNRWLYICMQKYDENYYPNPIAILMIFCHLFGTIVLSIIILFEILDNSKISTNLLDKFFRYKKPHTNKDDKRGWDGC